jgi:hypothetical protein
MGKSAHWRSGLAALSLAAISFHADATEGGLGRSVTGVNALSYAAIVPPEAGWVWQFGAVYYDGDIGGSRSVPIGGALVADVHAYMALPSVTALYVWNTGAGAWNYASAVSVPYNISSVNAAVDIGNLSVRRSDSVSDFFDLAFIPVIASHHFSQTEHMALSLQIFAPTADFEVGKLANAGLGVWTFSPTVSFTKIFAPANVEFTTVAAVDFSSNHGETDYESAPVFRLDGLLLKRFGNGWGIGAAGGWIEQIGDDKGPTADRLDGFKGHALGIGPVVSWGTKWEGGSLELQLRYIEEFDVENRIKGQPVMLTASLQL